MLTRSLMDPRLCHFLNSRDDTTEKCMLPAVWQTGDGLTRGAAFSHLQIAGLQSWCKQLQPHLYSFMGNMSTAAAPTVRSGYKALTATATS